jgi:hypothetical protein
MKKRKLFTIAGALAKLSMTAVLALGLGLIGCDNGTTTNTDPKSITITGIDDDGSLYIGIATSLLKTDNGLVAEGWGTVSNGSVTVALKTPSGNDWTGSGSYNIYVTFNGSSSYYTGGKSFVQLGITGQTAADAAKIPKYNITRAVSTIAANQFWTP